MAKYLFIVLLFSLISCDNDTSIPAVDESLYYPIEVNNEWVYEVTQTTYSVTEIPNSETYFYKETIAQLLDEEEKIYSISRSRRNSNSSNWFSMTPKLIRVSKSKLSTIEANGEDEILIFPIVANQTWNGLGKQRTAKVEASYIALQSNQLLIELQNDSSAIDLQRAYTVFELGTGPINHLESNLQFCQENPECIGKGIISSGKEINYTLISSVIN